LRTKHADANIDTRRPAPNPSGLPDDDNRQRATLFPEVEAQLLADGFPEALLVVSVHRQLEGVISRKSRLIDNGNPRASVEEDQEHVEA